MTRTATHAAAVTGAILTAATLALTTGKANAATHTPRCQPSGVGITLTHPVSESSQDGYTITETNGGEYACTVTGYPRLRLVLHRRHRDYRVRAIVTKGSTYFQPDPGPTSTTVQPGASVTAHVAYADFGKVQAVRTSGLVVRDQGTAWGLPVTFPGGAVDVWQARVTVTAWTKG